METNKAVRCAPCLTQAPPNRRAGIPSLKSLKMSLQPTGATQAAVARGTKIRPHTKQSHEMAQGDCLVTIEAQ